MFYFYMGEVLLPVSPEKLTTKIKNTNKTMSLINQSEVNFLRDAGLSEIDFEVLLPAVQYSFANYADGFKAPSYYLSQFEALKTEKNPFQFIVLRRMPDGKVLYDTNLTVSLESYTIKENSGDGFDQTVSITLKQFRPFGTKTVKVVENKATVQETRETTKSPAPKQETTYTVKSGDSLWNIAKKLYGNGSDYTKIYDANKDKISNPNQISVGQVLTIPPV